MRTNWEIALKGKLVKLVPYRLEHVLTYHGWMQDPWIREMTASEPLSLDEEYAMQLSWKEDEKKCTFIILGVETREGEGRGEGGGGRKGEGEGEGGREEEVGGEGGTEKLAMAGDVNLFFNDFDDPGMCEVEVMVAEPRWRRRGLAREAVLMLMRYALDNLGATTFYCKIGDANIGSRALFDKLGFSKHAYVEAFKETELRFRAEPGGATTVALRAQTEHVQTVPCLPPTAATAAAAVVMGEEGGATEEQQKER